MITAVVAMGINNEIGFENKLLWHLPKDLKHFKELTLDHPIIMGRKTYESIGKALPDRTNIVVSTKKDWFEEGILIVGTLKEALKFAKKINENVFIIGGGSIYEQTMEFTDILEVTKVDIEKEADTFFPKIDPAIWKITKQEAHQADEKNALPFTFLSYERITQLD